MVKKLNLIETSIVNAPLGTSNNGGVQQYVRIEVKATERVLPDGQNINHHNLGGNFILYSDWRSIRTSFMNRYPPGTKFHLIVSDKSIKKIGECTMYNSQSYLGHDLFKEWERIWKVTMNHVEEVGNKAFFCCKNLVDVELRKGECRKVAYSRTPLSSSNIAIFRRTSLSPPHFLCRSSSPPPSPVKNLGAGALSNCRALLRVALPKVEMMGSRTFENCSSLPELYLPSVVRIGMKSCSNMKALTYAFIPNCRADSFHTFSGCVNLRHVHVNTRSGSFYTNMFEVRL